MSPEKYAELLHEMVSYTTGQKEDFNVANEDNN